MPVGFFMALMALGSYVQYQANTAAQKKQRLAIANAAKRQGDLTEAAATKTVKYADDTYDPDTRAGNEVEAAKTAEASLMQQLVASGDRGINKGAGTTGRISNEYRADKAKMVSKNLARAANIAKLMGRARGATDLRFKEGVSGSRLGGEMADLEALMGSRAATDQGRIQLAGIVDPKKLFMGQLMSSAGSAGAAGGVGAGAGVGYTTNAAGQKMTAAPIWENGRRITPAQYSY